MVIDNNKPITITDCPDPDVIRVDDTYYMVCTTMYFMPGCEILRSYDLINWEHAAYVYDKLDSTPAQRLEKGESIYGQGMWAATLRYHDGVFYIVFVANDTKKTYLYKSKNIDGPWEKSYIEGFYHDCSLLFDDDRVYIAYGNREIYITELKDDLSGPKEGGLHRLAVRDTDKAVLGYEGTHLYKINNKYYLFFIHSREDMFFRKEACFVADSIDGEFMGGDILEDDMGYHNMGVAQGAIVDTPEGDWYAILFQDRGAIGRMPMIMPLKWENDYPVIGEDGKVPAKIEIKSLRPDYKYKPIVESDDFKGELNINWQFNHEPDLELFNHDKTKGKITITTGSVVKNVVQAKNTLTQRMISPACYGEITLDYSKLNNGDYAGFCALQGAYAFVGVTKKDDEFYVVMCERTLEDGNFNMYSKDLDAGHEKESILIKDTAAHSIRFKITADFSDMKDEASFYYDNGKGFEKIGPVHQLGFRLDHFTGARFGLFVFSTKSHGGSADFSNFVVNRI